MPRPLPYTFVLAVWLWAAEVSAAVGSQIFDDLPEPPIAVLRLDPSVRSTAMGGATGAVFWGVDPNDWANPALLGLARGVRHQDARQEFPTLSVDGTDLVFDLGATARREVLGYGGLGVALSGRPFENPGGIRLDEGTLTGYSADPGVPPPVYRLYDQVRSWGVGVSLAGVAGTIAALRQRPAPGFARHADLAFGYSEKSVELAPEAPALDGRGTARDWGLLARAAVPLGLGGLAGRLECAYGYSVLNANDVQVGFSGGGAAVGEPVHRNALAARAAIEAPAAWRRRVPAWLEPGFAPLLSIGGAWDARRVIREAAPDHDDRQWGVELGLANLVVVRLGRDGAGDATRGYGLGVPIGRFGGFRYDRATVSNDLGITYRGWVAWLDPLELIRAWR